ncbi:MAG: BON domain-containing protein [Bryobacteraceae bacterium]
MVLRVISVLLISVLALFEIKPALAQGNLNDDKIYDAVRQRLANDPVVKGADLKVTVTNGAVTIKGTVSTDKAREKATKLAKKVKGVTSVDNQLTIFGSD